MSTATSTSWWLCNEALPASTAADRARVAAAAELARMIDELPSAPRPRTAGGHRGEAWPVSAPFRERARALEPAAPPVGRRGARPARPRPLVLCLAWAAGVLTSSLYIAGLAELIARAIT